MREITVDNFAGGGGASTGIEDATGRSVDIAINHDPEAIRMHMVNHPSTKHYCENVWNVDPVKACNGRPVGLAWFSPDCKHFSKAKGGKPKDKNIRGLAWVALRWAGTVRPRVIMLENVEEFKTWGPLNRRRHPIKARQGETYKKFIGQLEALGYAVETRELIAADYGAPTKRKRFFMIARCDGKPIVWPEPTHGPRNSEEVKSGKLQPYVPAAEIIDWSIPCKSIFNRKKPLSENTMKRIAKGLQKFVFENPDPFIIQVNHGGENFRGQSIEDPMPTITAKHGFGVVMPYIMCNNAHNVGRNIQDPVPTITTGNRNFLMMPKFETEEAVSKEKQAFFKYLPKKKGIKKDVANGCDTICAVHIMQAQGQSIGTDIKDPLNTMTGVNHMGAVTAFFIKYYGHGVGQNVKEPLDTITSKDRFGLVEVHGEKYQIVDIGLRMLEPHELYAAQGFPDDYIIDQDISGKHITKTEQVKRCGNAVCPPIPTALVKANLPELCVAKRTPNIRPDRLKEEETGQLRFA